MSGRGNGSVYQKAVGIVYFTPKIQICPHWENLDASMMEIDKHNILWLNIMRQGPLTALYNKF